MLKKLSYILLLPLFLILAGCANSNNDYFTVHGDHQNLTGIWGHWDYNGNFIFYEFLGGLIMHGTLHLEEGIDFINLGGYHFHGVAGHSFFSMSLVEDGTVHAIEEQSHFIPSLNPEETQLRITDAFNQNEYIILSYMGNELTNLDNELENSEFLNGYQLSAIIASLWEMFTEPIFD